MTTFAVTNSNQLLPAVNYLLSNLDTTTAGNIVLPGNVLVANTTTGVISQSGNTTPFAYLYQYINLRYSNNATGTAGFDTNSNNYSYFGVYNSATPTPSANPAAYQWYEVSPPFDSATSRTLYYTAIGGRQIQWAAASAPPSTGYQVTVANVAIDLDVVTTAAGTPGERGPIAMAFVITTGNPNTATPAQLTAWFSASRENTVPPIGTGLTPVVGDTATFTWTAGPGQPSATLTYNGSIWIPVTGQVVNGNVIITGTIAGNAIIANTITSTQIATGTITANNIQSSTITSAQIAGNTITANNISTAYLYTGNIVSQTANIANANSAGYWLNYTTGSARFGGNVSIGNQLTVGNNAQIGGNLSVTGLVTAGNLNPNTVATTTIQPQAVSVGNSLSTTTVQTLAAVPIKQQFYFSTPNVNITTTQVNEAVYVWASVFANVTGSTAVAPSSVAIATRLSRFNSSGTGEVQIAGSIFSGISTTPGSFNLGDQFVYLGFLDTIATPGTYIYRLGAAVDSSGGSTTFTNLQVADRTILVQTLKR